MGRKGKGLYFPFTFSPILLPRLACSCCAGQTTNRSLRENNSYSFLVSCNSIPYRIKSQVQLFTERRSRAHLEIWFKCCRHGGRLHLNFVNSTVRVQVLPKLCLLRQETTHPIICLSKSRVW